MVSVSSASNSYRQNMNSSREVMALRNQQEQRNNDHLQGNIQNDRIQISKEGKQLYLASASASSNSWWDDLKDTASDWIDSSKRWLVDAGNFLLDAAKAGLDFLILDDVKTIFDPKASDAEKGFAILSLFPAGKGAKVGKKTYDLLKKYGDDVIDLANDVLKGRQKIGKYFVKSRIDEDKVILKETEKAMKSPIIQREANNLVEKYLRGLNPNKGSRPLFGNVHELRGEEGARVYYRMKGDTFEILGKSDKHNQQTVIDRLRKLYN
ncbi:hypothetical protein [Brevibacillus laterosporus]|uniref:Pre-toxin TG domain-containing protein n=2 Tax=Brevibacillus laterosporus TaxID=1465 RepID=A0A075R4S6_BRELA|nr:hypothetical protein [Brevibacillus laterosporus]AIG26829.1 hypothetical protein BRLA_c025090 [Brevibacillus laterosporus LMG 15441]RJL14517.1 hypothetical protein DM460_02485 [Brevibacillus laterosporus]CCF15436.1 hypothetical protein BLGI_3378 [Brevibacillus laterosporus GI-9]